ncbi:sugar-binding transcriptional regulator [Paracoccus aestuariivivens]|uniref:Transcriptional regulator n=1 Tax=Paracoccus aestuariivivens TaxID=1820333 RepID=A0A6L6JDV9_9RHOB|nr:sugar-binding domain-containing protein [Paracoccus aestuariivivens]MTH79706.1 transcriptional regulator [Paracoccus aestuariivivens]
MTNEDLPEADAFTVEVCWHYFVNELTQAQIAKAMGVTRLRVNQAIQRARSLGIVKVEIDSPLLPRFDLQDRLQKRFGLMRALVAPANPENYDYHGACGAALASYMAERLRSGEWRRIGVSWGMTLQCAINRMMRQVLPDLEVVSMIGGTSRGESLNAFGIASGLADRLGARYSLLAAPVFLASQIDRAEFLAQDIFTEHFEKLRQLDVAILTASNISERSYLIRTGLPAVLGTEDLIAAGVIGDVVSRFLDAEGNHVPTLLDDCTIGIELDVLRQVPERVLAAAGPHKVPIVRAALQAGLANVLITDDLTAKMVLDAD